MRALLNQRVGGHAHRPGRRSVRLAGVTATAVIIFAGAAAARANTFNVSTTAQLQAAVDASNANPGPDVINLGGGFYKPCNFLRMSDDLVINGPGIIDGDGTGSPPPCDAVHRVLLVDAPAVARSYSTT